MSSLSLKTFGNGDSTTSLDSPLQCLITPSVKKFFLVLNLNLPWWSSRLCPLVLSLIAWQKRPNPPATTSFHLVVEKDNIIPEPHLLQAKQPRLPWLLLMGLHLLDPSPAILMVTNDTDEIPSDSQAGVVWGSGWPQICLLLSP